MKIFALITRAIVVALAVLLSLPANALEFEQAWQIAQQRDPQLQRLAAEQRAEQADAIADGQLPDPQLFSRMEGIDLDGPSGGPGMVQIGVMQSFPAGRSLSLRSERGQQRAAEATARLADRQRRLRADLGRDWLTVLYWQQTDAILQDTAGRFDELVESVQSRYRVGLGGQQGLVQARLEALRFAERRAQAERELTEARARLSRWIGQAADQRLQPYQPEPLPVDSRAALEQRLESHPLLQSSEHRIAQRSSSAAIAREQYKPDWRAEAMYMHWRTPSMMGGMVNELGVGVSLSLPLFTGKRQDQRLDAANTRVDAARYAKADMTLQLESEMAAHWGRYEHLRDIVELYDEELLPGTEEAVETALASYQSQSSEDLTDLVRAHVGQAETRLNALRSRNEKAKALVELRYLVGNDFAEQ